MPPRGRERFPKSARLRKRPEFLSLSRTGKKFHSPNFIVISKSNERGESRLGITVSAKVGNALVRNRIKRLIREFFRRRRYEWIPGSDIVVIARKSAATLSSVLMQKELEKSVQEQRRSHFL
ncbi:MAG: ribonuclease P protein component [Alphaproteobacteria bacterium]